MIKDQKIRILVFALILLLAFTAPFWMPQYYVQSMTSALALGLVSMSFILLAGYCGLLSFAQMSFYAIAGYIIGIGVQDLKWPTFVVIPLALAGAVLLSAIFSIVSMRSSGIYFFMMTLALSQLFYGITYDWQSVTHGWMGIAGITRPSVFGFSLLQTNPRYYTTLFIVILCYISLLRIVNSQFGLALVGIRDNPKKMAALGYNNDLYRFFIMMISGFFAGIAGILGVYSSGGISPITADMSSSVTVLIAALIGSVYRLEGGLIGAITITFLINFTRQFTPRYWIIIGAIFILIMVFLPKGLLGINFKSIRFKRKAALKR